MSSWRAGGGVILPDCLAEVSRRHSRLGAGEASEAPQGRKAGQRIGQPQRGWAEGPTAERGSCLKWSGREHPARCWAPCLASGMNCRWHGRKRCSGWGEGSPRLNPPNRRIRDPNVRWCGRGRREAPPYPPDTHPIRPWAETCPWAALVATSATPGSPLNAATLAKAPQHPPGHHGHDRPGTALQAHAPPLPTPSRVCVRLGQRGRGLGNVCGTLGARRRRRSSWESGPALGAGRPSVQV